MAEVSTSPWSRNASGQPSADKYALGRGKLFYSELDASDDPDGDGWINLGNAASFTAGLTRNFLDHFTSQTGLRDRDARITIESLFDVRFGLEEPTEEAAVLFFSATPESYTNPTIAGFAEREMIAAVKLGRTYPILNAAGDQAFGVAAADVVVEAQGATQVVSSGGQTLQWATAGDTITRSTGSFITDGFRPGHPIQVVSPLNTGTFTIVTVAALVLTVAENLVNEGPLSAGETVSSADVLLANGTDYELDEAAGEIFFYTTTTKLFDGDAVDVTLTANALADSMRKIPIQSRGEVTVAFKFIGENPRDERRFCLYVPKMTINPDGDLGLITAQELLVIPFAGSALKRDVNTPIATIYSLPAGGVT